MSKGKSKLSECILTTHNSNYRLMKRDIETRKDIELLMARFYNRLLADPVINYLFIEVAKIDLPHHLPVIVDFWEMVLFQADTYRKNAIEPHLKINKESPIQKHHFDTWLSHFNQSIDELFEGNKAMEAKQKALSIATIMQIKIAQIG